jgi:hypothetical protein
MIRRGVPILAALLVGAALAAPAMGAEPPSGTITPDSGPISWQGQFYAAGGNTSNFTGDQLCAPSYPGGPNDPGAAPGVHQCDVFELTVDVPDGYWLTHSGGVSVDISWPSADNDFDMYIFKKPPPGEPVGPAVASSAAGGTDSEHAIVSSADGTYLVRVNPFSVAGSDYQGEVSFAFRDPIPNVPGGVRQDRASSTGYLSYSEPHISVDPLDPQHLVAASKMYQNLEEYKFKIGTFVSFDGGRTWSDNGHLPGYPKQDGDEGDEYHITSDPWTAFDDEGNAYTMVLDSPPDSQFTGAGWGMNLHKSTDGGRTWSGPIPIEKKQDPVTRELLLSDKNTVTVDNFGPNRDGTTGNMYACWSEDAPVANLEVLVGRSNDAGETWRKGQPVSGADRTVIGCYLVVGPPEGPDEPGVVYVFWLNFSDLTSSTGASLRMAKSTDGGDTYTPPETVVEINEIPSTFPNSAFRNLSIPAAAVDPNDGTVYLTWADYHATRPNRDCPEGTEEPDPGQVCDADILMARSNDGGESWSRPIRINQDAIGNGKDQFQPAIAATESGQVNMMWFDRRNDRQNFYIDTFLTRSNDQGKSWEETRVTKSMWDPSVNPPISPSGEFIGDYQGLAANDCFAYPFWNDTTLAQLPTSDPGHSPYQEVFSARIANTAEFGGQPVPGVNCAAGPNVARKCQGERPTIAGTAGSNVLRGTGRRDVILGLAGDDRIKGRGGKDLICGNGGEDTLRGNAGRDVLKGGGGGDELHGGGDNDRLGGAGGKDEAHGGGGKDRLRGGADADELRGDKGADRLRGNQGSDELKGGKGADELKGDKGADQLGGGPGRDHCEGGLGDDTKRACER